MHTGLEVAADQLSVSYRLGMVPGRVTVMMLTSKITRTCLFRSSTAKAPRVRSYLEPCGLWLRFARGTIVLRRGFSSRG